MKLGFLSAILPEQSLEEVLTFAGQEGFDCVELMCWPPGKAERRYAGVTHIDVTSLDDKEVSRIQSLLDRHQVSIATLGYYPNPLDPDEEKREKEVAHLKEVIAAAPKLGVEVVSTFAGRDHTKTIEDNWPLFETIWSDLVSHAESNNVKLVIEHCPMIFSNDEWPGGKNLAFNPITWRKMFSTFPSKLFGLCFDPSHLIWLHIDYLRCIREFADRIHYVHAKDVRIDHDQLYEQGVMGLQWHTPKIPGLGDVNWGAFFSTLTDTGYNGSVCVEVEDRAFEESLESRKRALKQSKRYLEQFVS